MKILAIDPSLNALKLLLNNLEQYGYEIQGALDIELARNAVRLNYRPEIVLINLALCGQTHHDDLRMFFEDLNNPYLIILAISDGESEAARLHASALGFRGFISKPFNIKSIISEIERVARLSTEELSFKSVDTRRGPRFRIGLEVNIEVFDEDSQRTFSEQTITEDISRAGALVLTMLEVRIGSVITVTVPEQEITSMAFVRGSFIGSDRIRRLNLEMMGPQWEEVFVRVSGETGEEGQALAAPPPVFVERADPTPGYVLNDRYKLQQLLGKGGLGVVYRALDMVTNQPVAIKLLLDVNIPEMEQAISRQFFEREIKILSEVRHPNIVNIVDSGISPEGQRFMVMDFIEGTPLNELLRAEGNWHYTRVLHLLKQICPALHSMHLKNIIHRDLKPANIMIQGTGKHEVAILLDLGIAKMVRGAKESSLIKSITKTGIVVGTVYYISPEQCLDEAIDERADIYSLGILIYELLCGRVPFTGMKMSTVLLAQVMTPPPPIRDYNPKVPKEIERVVFKALAKEREKRPATTMDLLQLFQDAVTQLENGVTDMPQTIDKYEDSPLIFPED